MRRGQEPIDDADLMSSLYEFEQQEENDGSMSMDYAVRLLRSHIAYTCAFITAVAVNLEDVDDDFRALSESDKLVRIQELWEEAERKKVEYGKDLHNLGYWVHYQIFQMKNEIVIDVLNYFRKYVGAWAESIPENDSLHIIKLLQDIRWSSSVV